MENYRFKIGEKEFEGKISYETIKETSILDYLYNFAPLYYAFKYKNEESYREILSDYTFISMFSFSRLSDLKFINEYQDYKEQIINDEKKAFIFKLIDACLKTVFEDRNIERFLSISNSWNYDNQSKRVQRVINELIGFTYHYHDKLLNIKGYQDYVKDLLQKLLRNASADCGYFLNKYWKDLDADYLDYLYFFCTNRDYGNFSRNTFVQKTNMLIEETIKKEIDFLSLPIETTDDYKEKIIQIKNSLPTSYCKKDKTKCIAIASNNTNVYVAFSGCYISDGDQKKLSDLANTFNDGKRNITVCMLPDGVRNYLDRNQKQKKYYDNDKFEVFDRNYYENLKTTEYGKYFSCCERKILVQQPSLQDFELLVLFTPCENCAKPLYKNYKKLFALIAFFDDKKYIQYSKTNEKDFSCKEYTIEEENQLYISKEIKK